MNYFTLLLFLLLLNTIQLNSQTKVWEKLYLPDDLSGMSQPVDQVSDNAGNIYITGYEWIGSNYVIITYKLNWRGEIEWMRKYSEENSNYNQSKKIILDSENNLIVLGYNINSGTGSDIILLKYSSDGDLIWQNRYSSNGYFDDLPITITIDDNSNIYLVGETVLSDSNKIISALKYSSTGHFEWIKDTKINYHYSGSKRKIFFVNNQIIVVGMINNIGTLLYQVYSKEGDLVTDYVYEFTSDTINNTVTDYEIDNNSNLYVLGIQNLKSFKQDWILIKINPSGTTDWSNIITKTSWVESFPVSINILNTGNILVLGNELGYAAHITSHYFRIFELNQDGVIIKNKGYSGIYYWAVNSYSYLESNKINNDRHFIENNGTIYFLGTSSFTYKNIFYLAKISNDSLKWTIPIKNSSIFQNEITTPLLIDKSTHLNLFITGSLKNNIASHTITQRITESEDKNIKISLESPLDGASISQNVLTLKWIKINDQYSYRTLISKSMDDFDNNIVLDMVTKDDYIEFPRQKVNENYYWKVYGFDETSITSSSNISSFKFLNISKVDSIKNSVSSFTLKQNYPNPFNSETIIEYSISDSKPITRVILKIFNLLGEEIKTIFDQEMSPGFYKTVISSGDIANGIYYYQLKSESAIITKKMVILK